MENFDLKKFLTENKLTTASKLLEQEEDYKYFDSEGMGGTIIGTVDGTRVYAMEDSSVFDTVFYALEKGTDVQFLTIETGGETVTADEIQQEHGVSPALAQLLAADIESELSESRKKVSKLTEDGGNIKIVKTDGQEVEFIYNGKPHTVYFDSYEASDYHGNNFSTGYLTGEDQYGGQWAIDAAEDGDYIVDFDIDTIEKIY